MVSPLHPASRSSYSEGYDSSLSDHNHPEGSFPHTICSNLAKGEFSMELHAEGAGGTYLVKDIKGHAVAVFKPAEEEIGQPLNPKGNCESDREQFEPGQGYVREILAYHLDHNHAANVPETHEITLAGKVGSIQQFIPDCVEAGNVLPGRLPVEDVHYLAIFDIRTLNGDRHGGNILVAPDRRLVPIDHAFILPSGYADPDFEWMMWPQAKVPFSDAEMACIDALDPDADQSMVRSALGEEAGEVIAVTTRLLKHAARRGYTPQQIAQFVRRETLALPSHLEDLIARSRRSLDEGAAIDMARIDAFLEEMLPALHS